MLKVYEFAFETDSGMDFASISACSLSDATKMLIQNYPDDIGSDGFVTLPDGDEQPINW